MIFQPIYSSAGPRVGGASPGSSGCKAGAHPGQDALPSQGHPHSLRLGQCRHARWPNGHIFGMWEDTAVPGENAHGHGENMQTTQTVALAGNQFFSPHHRYNKMTLDKMLFEGQLYYTEGKTETSIWKCREWSCLSPSLSLPPMELKHILLFSPHICRLMFMFVSVTLWLFDIKFSVNVYWQVQLHWRQWDLREKNTALRNKETWKYCSLSFIECVKCASTMLELLLEYSPFIVKTIL